jgi:hypothetical protein
MAAVAIDVTKYRQDTVFELSTKLLSKVGNARVYIEPSYALDHCDHGDHTMILIVES